MNQLVICVTNSFHLKVHLLAFLLLENAQVFVIFLVLIVARDGKEPILYFDTRSIQ